MSRRTDELLAAWHAGELSAEDSAELLAALEADPQLCNAAVKQLIIERHLRALSIFQDADIAAEVVERLGAEEHDEELTEGVMAQIAQEPLPVPSAVKQRPAEQVSAPVASRIPKPRSQSATPQIWPALAGRLLQLAGLVLIAALGFWGYQKWIADPGELPIVQDPPPATPVIPEPPTPTPVPVPVPAPSLPEPEIADPSLGIAKLIGGMGTGKWSKPTPIYAGTESLPKGTLSLKLKNGVLLRLEGKSSWELKSLEELVLIHGKLSAEVPDSANGFTVQANKMKVRDLGTRFAISANERGDSAVLVYEGQVEASVSGKDDAPVLLSRAEAVRLNLETETLVALSNFGDLFAPPPSYRGIVDASNVEVLDEAPESLKLEDHPEKTCIAFCENYDVEFEERFLDVNFSGPGSLAGDDGAKERLRFDDPVQLSFYLLHFQGSEDGASIRGWIRFEQPILGVITDYFLLNETDELGNDSTRYPNDISWRGLEGRDVIRILEDERTLEFELGATSLDEVRVVVREE